jgi:hypothetical protein
MGSKSSNSKAHNTQAVTAQRAARLYKLLRLLGQGPQTRASLMRRLKLDVRGFYRDLEVLRAAEITVVLHKRRYCLEDDLDDAIVRLPFPDPHLVLGEAMQLAKGRTKSHRKLKQIIASIVE